jgi:hypothetical protein
MAEMVFPGKIFGDIVLPEIVVIVFIEECAIHIEKDRVDIRPGKIGLSPFLCLRQWPGRVY